MVVDAARHLLPDFTKLISSLLVLLIELLRTEWQHSVMVDAARPVEIVFVLPATS